jgi:hypothetical protein
MNHSMMRKPLRVLLLMNLTREWSIEKFGNFVGLASNDSTVPHPKPIEITTALPLHKRCGTPSMQMAEIKE